MPKTQEVDKIVEELAGFRELHDEDCNAIKANMIETLTKYGDSRADEARGEVREGIKRLLKPKEFTLNIHDILKYLEDLSTNQEVHKNQEK